MEEELEEWKEWAIEVLYKEIKKEMKKERTTRYLKLRRKYTELKAKTKEIMKKRRKAMIARIKKKKEEAKAGTEKGQLGYNIKTFDLYHNILLCQNNNQGHRKEREVDLWVARTSQKSDLTELYINVF